MTFQIALVLIILGLAVLLFITDRLRSDLVALLVVGALAVSGLVSPAEALSGFSNPAVITVWAMFIISGGLAATGVADQLGDWVLQLAGESEIRLLVIVMMTSAVLSAFMNSVGVVALLLPVIITIARQTGHSPSRLLLPLAFSSLLGGMATLVGTSSNLLVSQTLRQSGLSPFNLFDFAPVGLVVVLVGIVYMVVIGRHLLPERTHLENERQRDLGTFYGVQERLQLLAVPGSSPLVGRQLLESRLGGLLGLNVIGILRQGEIMLAPDPSLKLAAEDRLLVVGKINRLDELQQNRLLRIEPARLNEQELSAAGLSAATLVIPSNSHFVGKTPAGVDFRGRFGVNIIAIHRHNHVEKQDLGLTVLAAGDRLVALGMTERIEALAASAEFKSSIPTADEFRYLDELVTVQLPPASSLVGKSLVETHLGDSADLTILGRLAEGQLGAMPAAAEKLQAEEILLAHISRDNLAAWSNLATLRVDNRPIDEIELETDQVGFVEVTLSPYAAIDGKTLRELHFRQKYGLTAVAFWRDGRTHRQKVRDRPLRMGDGLLLYGPRSAWPVLADDPNFIVLEMDVKTPPRRHKARLSVLILVAVMVPVLLSWLPISIAAVIGASLMVLLGCLTMDEAYRYIEWRAVFLIAGMMPLGIAMESTQTTALIANGVIDLAGGWGITAVLAGLFLLTNLASQLMPNTVVIVLMAPIALQTAIDLGASPQTFMMTIALAAINLLSPVGHPANTLVMGPGGYRFTDYLKVGLPLMLLILLIAIFFIPVVWPL